jgi:hypothetical protein
MEVTKMNKQDWINKIIESGGKPAGTVQHERILAEREELDISWFYHNSEDYTKKASRDKIAREMRKDAWIVKTESNTLGWFISAYRELTEELKPGCFGAYGSPSCNIPRCSWFARCKQSQTDY